MKNIKCSNSCNLTNENICCLSCKKLESCKGVCISVKRKNFCSPTGFIGKYSKENVSKCDSCIEDKKE